MKITNNISKELFKYSSFLFAIILLTGMGNLVIGQANNVVPFAKRTGSPVPLNQVYNLKGNFTMIGNSNLTLENYGLGTANSNNPMRFIDIDNDNTTYNSSSAHLSIPDEDGAGPIDPACSRVVFAGLYWMGRAENDNTNLNTISVTELIPTGQSVSNGALVHNGNLENNPTGGSNTRDVDLDVNRIGVANSYDLEYIFDASGNNDGEASLDLILRFYFTPLNGSWVDYSTNGGTDFHPAHNQVMSLVGTTRTVTFDPVTARNQTSPGHEVKITSLTRSSNGNLTEAQYRTTAPVASAAVTITFLESNTKNLSKNQVKFKRAGGAYSTVTAIGTNVYFPAPASAVGNAIYTGYADVTSLVNANPDPQGEYFVADIALQEGDGGSTGFFGCWSLVVVYENSLMLWRNIAIFDGYAINQAVTTGTEESSSFTVTGFQSVQNGDVNVNLGIMAGEGDRGIGVGGGSGGANPDFFDIRNAADNDWVRLSHSGNSQGNFFNSSVVTGGNARNPNIVNNTGIDVAKFPLNNADKSIIANGQTETSFRYGTAQDLYVISLIVFGVDAYIPDVLNLQNLISINGNTNPPLPLTVLPGEEIEYEIEIVNGGSEAVLDLFYNIPIPAQADFVPGSITYTNDVAVNAAPTFNGGTNAIEWDFGTLPLQADKTLVVATLKYKVTATTSCLLLKNSTCQADLIMNGTSSGIGEISQTPFANIPFVFGFLDAPCNNVPNPVPFSIEIDATAYVDANCQDVPPFPERDILIPEDVNSIPVSNIDAENYYPDDYSYWNLPPPVGFGHIQYQAPGNFPITIADPVEPTTFYVYPAGSQGCYYILNFIPQEGVLPANGLELKAFRRGNDNVLEWMTLTEANTKQFVVERSTNGVHYSALQNAVKAAGYSNLPKHYGATDKGVTGNLSYYRIRSEDQGGKISYSNVAIVRTTAITTLRVFPNPVADRMYVEFAEKGRYRLDLFNHLGQQVSSQNATIAANNMFTSISRQSLPTGSYVLRIVNQETGKIESVKVQMK